MVTDFMKSNLADFMAMKSGGFHHEIWQISCQGLMQCIKCISVLVLMKNTAFSGRP